MLLMWHGSLLKLVTSGAHTSASSSTHLALYIRTMKDKHHQSIEFHLQASIID